LDIHNISVASAAAADTVLLGLVVVLPVLILLDALLLVERRRLEVGRARELSGGGVRRAMLDGGVPVAKVSEVVDVLGAEKSAGSEGVDGGITPLQPVRHHRQPVVGDRDLLVPSRSHRCDPSSQRNRCTPCCGTSRAAQSQSWTRSDTCCTFHPP